MKKYKIPRDTLKDIEFIKREFGMGSVAYRVTQKLIKDINKLINRNEELEKYAERMKFRAIHSKTDLEELKKINQELEEKMIADKLGDSYFSIEKSKFIKLPKDMSSEEYKQWRNPLS